MHRILGAMLALVAAASLSSMPASASATDPTRLIQSVAAQVAEIVKSRAQNEREAGMRQLLRHDFDLSYIASSALGAHWNDASEAQKARILAAFEATEAKSYADRLASFSSVTINGATAKSDGVWSVNTNLNLTGGQSMKVDWEVRQSGAELRISDVKVSGVSLFTAQRASFRSYVQMHNGEVEPLVQVLEARAAR